MLMGRFEAAEALYRRGMERDASLQQDLIACQIGGCRLHVDVMECSQWLAGLRSVENLPAAAAVWAGRHQICLLFSR